MQSLRDLHLLGCRAAAVVRRVRHLPLKLLLWHQGGLHALEGLRRELLVKGGKWVDLGGVLGILFRHHGSQGVIFGTY
jgi:hypothetical protein